MSLFSKYQKMGWHCSIHDHPEHRTCQECWRMYEVRYGLDTAVIKANWDRINELALKRKEKKDE